MKDPKNKVHSTKEGKLFIRQSEFFAREEVQSMIKKLMDSTLFKKIKESQTSGI
jgi:hypothetical protein